MKIEDLDEWQGCDRAAVYIYLTAKGWSLANGFWSKPGGNFCGQADDGRLIEIVANLEDCTPQALLRDINPRLHKGWPSDAALLSHGLWIAGLAGTEKLETLTSFVVAEWKAIARFTIRCWPCDAHGNKCRWPERDGVML